MGRKRKNPEDEKLPPRVSRGKYTFYFKPTSRETIHLGSNTMTMSALWAKYDIEVGKRKDVMTFAKLWGLYLNSAYYKELKPRTQKDYLQHQKKLLLTFGKMRADSIKPEHIRRFMDKRGLQSKTQANHEMASMSRAFRWGHERGYVKGNPCAGISKFKMIPRDYYAIDEEYVAVYEEASDRLKVAMEISYLCASRAGDITKVKWSDELELGLFIQQGKTGKKQIKAWSERLKNALDLARKVMPPTSSNDYIIVNTLGGKLTTKTLNNWWLEARRKASENLGRTLTFTFHDLKAKGISDYEGTSRDKQLFSGHKTESQVLIYDRKLTVTPSLDMPPIKAIK